MPCDFDPSGRTPVDVVAAIFDLEPAPAATVSAQEIAEMRGMIRCIAAMQAVALRRREIVVPRHIAEQVDALIGTATLAHRMMPVAERLIDAIEALTAKNQRLTDALNTTALEACEAIDDRLKPEIERLRAENARLRCYARHAPSRDHFDIVCEALAEIKATIEGEGHPGQTVEDIVNGCLAEIAALPRSNGDRPAGWPATRRSQVEAAHAAAAQAQRQAECRNCRDGFPAYGTWPDFHICPMCKRDCRSDAAKDDGIDMALLGQLCSEEPDADTKREVERLTELQAIALATLVDAGESLEAAGIVSGKVDRAIEALRRGQAQAEAAHAAAKADALWNGPMTDVVEAIRPSLTDQAAGIDMALLGQLCSEEPDADTKREVVEMMATIRTARESAKDGD